MRTIATLLAAAVIAAPAFAEQEHTGPIYEPDTYRFGGTYSVVGSGSASQCASTCGQDNNCLAWSFVDLPGTSSKFACELKSTTGRAEINPTSISGISPRHQKTYQPDILQPRTTLSGGRSYSSASPTLRTRTAPTTTRRATTARTVTQPKRTTQAVRSVPRTTSQPVRTVTNTSTVRSPLYKTPPAQPVRNTVRTGTATRTVTAPTTTRTAAPVTTRTVSRPAPTTATRTVTRPAPTTTATGTVTRPSTTTTTRTVSTAPSNRTVLNGQVGGVTAAGGVGGRPAAPINRNIPPSAQTERTPWTELGDQEYPDYSVSRAAEDGAVAPIGEERPSGGYGS